MTDLARIRQAQVRAAEDLICAELESKGLAPAPHEWLDNVEAELRKVPGLDERDVEVLTAMASAGFDYAEALKQREARPVCQYTGKRCRYYGAQCTCHPHGLPGMSNDQQEGKTE
jgi:hypothetical protein